MFIKKLLSITPSEPSHMRCDFEDLFRKLNAEFYRRSGDSAFRKVFSTPTSVLGAPTGEMLMESLQSRSLLPKGPVTVFEIGPGNGDLATGVIRFLNRGLIGSRYIVGNFEGIDSATITGQETKTVAVSVTPFDASYCYEPQVKKKFPSKVDVVILNELLDDLPPTPVLWSKEESCFMAELTKGKFTKIEEGSDLHLTLACIPEPMRRQLVDTGVVFYLNPHFYHILKTAKDCLTPDGIIVVMDYFTISPPLSVRFYPAQTPTGIPYTPDTVQELCHDTIPPNITHNVWGPLLLKIGKEVGLRLTELTTMVTLIDQFDSAVDRLFGRDFRYRGEVYTQEELLAQEGFEFFSRFLSHSKLQSHHLSVLDLVIFLEMYSKMQKSFESELTSFLTGALTLTHFSFIIASNFFDDEACCGLIRPFQTLLEMVKAEKIDLGDPKYQVFLSRSSFNQIGWRVNTDHIAIIFRNSSSPTQVSPKTVFLTSSSLHNPAVPYLSSLKPDRTQMDLAQKDFHFTKLLMQAFKEKVLKKSPLSLFLYIKKSGCLLKMYAYKKEDLEAFAALYTPSNPEKLRSIQYVDNPDADFAYIKMTCGLLDDELQTKELRISMIEMLNSQLPQGARYTQSRDESSDVYITKLCCHLLKYCETIGLVSLKNARIAAAKPAKYKSSDKTTQKYPSLKTTPVDLVRNLSTYYFLILCTLHDCLE